MNFKSTIQWATPYSLGLLLALAVAALAGFALSRWASGRPIAPARRVGLLVIRLAILAILGLIISTPCGSTRRRGRSSARGCSTCSTRRRAWRSARARRPDGSRCCGSIRDADPCPRPAGRGPGQPVPVRQPPGRGGRGLPAGPKRAEPASRGARRGGWPPSRRDRPRPPPAPTDSDTLLGASLEGLTDRFGQAPPQAVVVFSDGRARDPDRADAIARAYGRMKVPDPRLPGRRRGRRRRCGHRQHGRAEPGPEVLQGRRAGLRAELRLQGQTRRAEDRGRRAPDGKPEAVLARTPVVLEDGLSELLARRSSRATRTVASRPGSIRSRARCRRRTTPSGPTWRSTTPRSACSTSKGRPSASSQQAVQSGLRPRRGPRGLFTAPGGADGGPGHRVHGRDGLAGRRAISPSRCARTTEDRDSPKSPRSSSPTTRSS